MRVLEYAIGDVHGHIEQLTSLLNLIADHSLAHDVEPHLIFLGDLIDRGPSGAEVVELVRFLKESDPATVTVLRGNHEDWFGDALPFVKIDQLGVPWVKAWLSSGGLEHLKSYEKVENGGARLDSDAAWLSRLPVIQVSNGRVYVHAGLEPKVPLDQQPLESCLWIRDKFFRSSIEDFPGVSYVVHGHTPTRWVEDAPEEEVEIFDWRCNVDTGVFFTGVLAAAVFDPGQPGRPIDVIYARGAPSRAPWKKRRSGLITP